MVRRNFPGLIRETPGTDTNGSPFLRDESRIRPASSGVNSPEARPDAIAWFEYSGLMVAKISDCVRVGVDIYTNNDGTAKKDSNRFLIFCQGTPDQIRTGVAGSKVLHD